MSVTAANLTELADCRRYVLKCRHKCTLYSCHFHTPVRRHETRPVGVKAQDRRDMCSPKHESETPSTSQFRDVTENTLTEKSVIKLGATLDSNLRPSDLELYMEATRLTRQRLTFKNEI
ncbi:unnamed protein product, partial [Brenthis ino]